MSNGNNLSGHLVACLKARLPGVIIRTLEEERALATLRAIAANLNRPLFRWSVASGLWKLDGADENDTPVNAQAGLDDACKALCEAATPDVLVLCDPWPVLDSPVMQRLLRETLFTARRGGKTIVLVGRQWNVPPELQDDLNVCELPLPSKDELQEFIKSLCDRFAASDALAGKITIDPATFAPLARACQGLTLEDASTLVRLALFKFKAIDQHAVKLAVSEKKQIVSRGGVLSYEEPSKAMQDVGGLHTLKDWLAKRGKLFSPEARAAGIKPPKGVLLVGVPGTGKTLSARAVASAWGQPLVKLDAGKLFGSLVGESESNLRQALQTAEAVAPCVLMIDELEKGFSQTGGHDGGTTARVFGTFLSWLQDHTAEVFVVATANDITALPPELLRKGRFDEIFFVDLPDAESRYEILRIYAPTVAACCDAGALLAALSSSAEIVRVTQSCQGFTGAEIEAAVQDARIEAFNEGKDLAFPHLLAAIQRLVPLSKTMGERIKALREFCKSGRARPAGATLEQDAAKQAAPLVEV